MRMIWIRDRSPFPESFLRKLDLSLSFKSFKATLEEFAQFGITISAMLRLKAWVPAIVLT